MIDLAKFRLEQLKIHDKMYRRLKSMRVQASTKPPEWENCINCSWDEPSAYNEGKDAIYNNLAGVLIRDSKIPLEIIKIPNAIFVRTENQNA